MKCLEYVGNDEDKIGEVIRTNEQAASQKVASGDWFFCHKSVWKDRKKWSKGDARNLGTDR